MALQPVGAEAQTTVNTSVIRTRNYLTGTEVEILTAAARKVSRYGHRDATMIVIAYRHGLRAGELCDPGSAALQMGQLASHRDQSQNPLTACVPSRTCRLPNGAP